MVAITPDDVLDLGLKTGLRLRRSVNPNEDVDLARRLCLEEPGVVFVRCKLSEIALDLLKVAAEELQVVQPPAKERDLEVGLPRPGISLDQHVDVGLGRVH